MLRAGAVAVVSKERAIEDLYDAIQRAIALPFEFTRELRALDVNLLSS